MMSDQVRNYNDFRSYPSRDRGLQNGDTAIPNWGSELETLSSQLEELRRSQNDQYGIVYQGLEQLTMKTDQLMSEMQQIKSILQNVVPTIQGSTAVLSQATMIPSVLHSQKVVQKQLSQENPSNQESWETVHSKLSEEIISTLQSKGISKYQWTSAGHLQQSTEQSLPHEDEHYRGYLDPISPQQASVRTDFPPGINFGSRFPDHRRDLYPGSTSEPIDVSQLKRGRHTSQEDDNRVSFFSKFTSSGMQTQQNNKTAASSTYQNDHGMDDNRRDPESHLGNPRPKRVEYGKLGNRLYLRGGELPVLSNQNQTNHGGKSVDLIPIVHKSTKPKESSLPNQSQPMRRIEDEVVSDEEEVSDVDEDEEDPVDESEIKNLVKEEALKAKSCTDTKSQGLDTVLCIDCSHSMKGNVFSQLTQGIIEFTDGLEKAAIDHGLEENLALVCFGKKNSILQHLTNDFGKVLDVIENIIPDGPSPLRLGLMLASTEITVRGGNLKMSHLTTKPRIILISDGIATDEKILTGPDSNETNKKVCDQVLKAVRNIATIVDSITCIPVGSCDFALLNAIADAGHGKIASIEEMGRLSRFFRKQYVANDVIKKSDRSSATLSQDQLKRQILELGVVDEFDETDIVDIISILRSNFPKRLVDSGPVIITPPHTLQNTPPEPIKVGNRVRRTSEWNANTEGLSDVGTVVVVKKTGSITVHWDTEVQTKCRYGADGVHEVRIVEEPRIVAANEQIAVGVLVKRGPSWRWGDQDGGEGNLGTVIAISDKGQVNVAWSGGQQGNYRYGYSGKYDLEICSPDVASKGPIWELQNTKGTWEQFPEYSLQSIEEAFNGNNNGTMLLTVEKKMYRLVFSSMEARDLSNQQSFKIRRKV
ncbi:hypothetical protein CHS0354_030038 [Potamilus streckersoni]|uniref:VWFA domain-containing protein n=1 Tax=Potamilus streckersoni TaxID=2493646 RepID=A0AAE0TIR2_9BIVA|nr:hypothetical protein CHS0354_030038 [Potamilus streckersoni]